MLRALLAVLLLGLCPALAAKTPPVQEALAGGQGAVLFQLSNDFPAVFPGALIPQISVTPAGSDGKTVFFLEGGSNGFRTTRSYLGALPPGRYRFVDFQAVDCKILCADPALPAPMDMPEFDISAGRIRYLGTIALAMVSTSATTNPAAFRNYWSWKHTPDMAEAKHMLGVYPDISAFSASMDSGWAGNESTTAEMNRIQMKARSYGMLGATDYGEDGFYFSSHNGMIKRYKPGGALEFLHTGHDLMVTSVRELPGGSVFTTGEAGMLGYSADGGMTWVDRGEGLPFGLTTNAVVIGDDEVAFTLQKKDSVSLYRGKASGGEWRKIGDFPLVFATWTGLPGAQPELFHHNGTLVLTLPSRKIAVIDLTTGTSTLRDLPGSIATAKLSADGVLRCACAKSIATSPYESRDYGQTWTPAAFNRFLGLPEFHDAQNGFSYQGAPFSAKKSGLSFTRDGGKTWDFTHHPDLSRSWWQPAYSRNGKVLMLYSISFFGQTALQIVRTSVDSGKTWQPLDGPLLWPNAPASAQPTAYPPSPVPKSVELSPPPPPPGQPPRL